MNREIFIARQPIYDAYLNVFAYEILYRTGDKNMYDGIDGDMATSSVISDVFLTFGIKRMTDLKKAFINFTPNLLMNGIPSDISNEFLVVEILEDVIPTKEIINAVIDIKSKGYKIALDDFVLHNVYDELIQYADIIKIDYMGTTSKQRKNILKKHKKKGIKFLAEKIETYDEFKEAVEMGFEYFQGYFFSKPVLVKAKDISEVSSNYVAIFDELDKEEPSYELIADIFKRDLNLSYKLLRLVNSPAFYKKSRIDSLQSALVYLGFKEIRKWLSILMIRDIGGGYNEMVRTSLVRAKVAEEMARNMDMRMRKSELFMLGLFSLLDKITGNSLVDIMENIPIEDDIKAGILGRDNKFGRLLKAIDAYEHGDWERYEVYIKSINAKGWMIPDYYYKALRWINEFEEEGDSDE
ncbi:MAG: HDOD domain-containing protein [Firmicutes bacterium]|jgi:EAL and modified HD-GYP domain-containing signal transduction protein|nr:HDOD domain-containing protein [Bacillota bacterium]